MEKGPKKKRAEARLFISHDDAATAYSAAAPSPSSTAFIDRRMRPCLSTSSTLTLTMSPSLIFSETFSTRSFDICDPSTRPSLPGAMVTNAPKSLIDRKDVVLGKRGVVCFVLGG